MKQLSSHMHTITLVDQVESNLLEYFKNNNLSIGSTIPNETELTAALGVARGVLREALSRLKMIGLIEARTRRGMIITEPSILVPMRRALNPNIMSAETMLDILEFRISLELGMCEELFFNITEKDINELEAIVLIGEVTSNNVYAVNNEFAFHAKLYEIVGNRIISEFQDIIHNVMVFIKEQFDQYFVEIAHDLKKEFALVTHADLLEKLKNKDMEGYVDALNKHFHIYKVFLRNRRKQG